MSSAALLAADIENLLLLEALPDHLHATYANGQLTRPTAFTQMCTWPKSHGSIQALSILSLTVFVLGGISASFTRLKTPRGQG